MNTKSNARTNRPLPNDYNKIGDLDMRKFLFPSPKRERKRRKVNYTRIIAIIIVILLAILIVFAYYIMKKESNICVKNPVETCAKKDCVLSAALILKPMDPSFYPCDDFYQYSCGNSRKYDPKNPNNFIDQIESKLKLDLKNSIETFSDGDQPKYIRKLYKFYRSCLNEALIEKEDIKPLNNIIKELGGWPVIKGDRWQIKTKNYHWINTYIMMRKIGINANSLFKLVIKKDIKNSSRFIVHIDQPEFTISAQSLNDSELYFNLMVKIAEMMGSDKVDAQNNLLQVLIFEKELISLTLSEEDHRNNTYLNNNYMNLRQMQISAPNINWLQILTEFIGKPVNENMELKVLVPTYIRKLNQKLIQTESRVLANYLIWKVIYQCIPLLSKRWREPMDKYLLNTVENYQKENRWQMCLRQSQKFMSFQIGNVYMKKHFSKRNEVEVISMINDIKESFIEILDKNKWMSEEVRAKAKEKILLMELRIGFPKELLDEDLMDSWLKDVNIEKEFFKNVLRLNLFSTDEEMHNLNNSDNNPKLLWQKYVNPAEIVLKYKAEENALLISAALINDFYKEDLPKYLSYGSLGVLISQQIINVFNEIGRLYDENGLSISWWDRPTVKNFDDYKRCFEKQIIDSDDVMTAMSNTERNKLIEQLIADNTALMQPIVAYQRYVERFGPEVGLVGINHTSEQLLWIKAVNTFCNYNNDNRIQNSNDMIKFRINTILSNVKKFSIAFDCKPESAMNSPINC